MGKSIIQMSDGKLIFYDHQNRMSGKEQIALPKPSKELKVHRSGIYSLSEDSRFYVNGSQVVSEVISSGNVTSFLLKDPYILLTTSYHKLLILMFNHEKVNWTFTL